MAVTSPRQGYRFPADCALRFRAERLLASGGYGAVLEATQLELGRPVVVKLLLADALADPQQRARFENEARIAATLSHPHIARVLDHGSVDLPWIAYELVAGGSLRARVEAGRLAPPLVVAVGVQMASALAAAHQLGILHRDVKPDNVLGGPEHWKLTDFGIARWDHSLHVRTERGLMLGTPAYLAPEVIRGEEAGPGQDVYALGIMLYELACGRPPFEGDNPYAVLEAHLASAAAPLGERVPDLPHALADVIHRAIAKDRNLRFATAEEMGRALERALAAPDAAGDSAPRASGGRSRGTGTRALPREPARAAAGGRGRAWMWAASGAAACAVLAAALALRSPAPEPGPAATVRSAPLPRPAGDAEVRELVARASRGAAAQGDAVTLAFMEAVARVPRVDARVPVPEAFSEALSSLMQRRSRPVANPVEELAIHWSRADLTPMTTGNTPVSKLNRRRDGLARMAREAAAEHAQLSRRIAGRRAAWVADLRCAHALRMPPEHLGTLLGQLVWEGQLRQVVLGEPRGVLRADLRAAEDGRPESWTTHYVRMFEAGCAEDESLASLHAAHAFTGLEADLGHRRDEVAITMLILDWRDVVPSRSGARYEKGREAARKLALAYKGADPLNEDVASFLSLGR